ncbi:MAG: hypothetical protein A2V70_12290 [Planctomycetes bacterium RBG_13_63_9]|nr:MAG: hypothetical protein A2V70_12290 [Planctomycetes bacterium RBG_13_63_9]
MVDNQHAVPRGTTFFPQILQKAGCQTVFIGKWHMGHEDDSPHPGFDYWASFKGQDVYSDPRLNINGKMQQSAGYNADVLTRLAIEWLQSGRDSERPFFLYLSYRAVHYPFQPAERDWGLYAEKPIDYPETMGRMERNYRAQPRWVRERRYWIRGIDHMEIVPFDKAPVPVPKKLTSEEPELLLKASLVRIPHPCGLFAGDETVAKDHLREKGLSAYVILR